MSGGCDTETVDITSFLGLEPGRDRCHWRLPVEPRLTTGGDFLFGGAGLSAAVAALEGTTGRPLVWATAQYLSFARPGSVVDLDVTIVTEGRASTQARVVASVERPGVQGDGPSSIEILTVNGALGTRDWEGAPQWAERPVVPAPDDCPPQEHRHGHDGRIHSTIETRLASGRQRSELDGTPGDGRSALWARVPGLDMSSALLGLVGDYVPFGVGQALGMHAGGRSLDNTIRVAHLVPSEWVLLDVRVHAVGNGYGHGLVHLWAEDGTLLGTASQTCAVRHHRD
jgi:acyl-CoA thioesterase